MAVDASSSREGTTISQINVTPLVDVMLVLLVIFMVTAPIIQQGVQVNLPQTKANAIAGSEEPLIVTVAKDGKIYLNDNVIGLADLGTKLSAIRKIQADKQVYLRADQDVRYGTVMKTIAEIKQAQQKGEIPAADGDMFVAIEPYTDKAYAACASLKPPGVTKPDGLPNDDIQDFVNTALFDMLYQDAKSRERE